MQHYKQLQNCRVNREVESVTSMGDNRYFIATYFFQYLLLFGFKKGLLCVLDSELSLVTGMFVG